MKLKIDKIRCLFRNNEKQLLILLFVITFILRLLHVIVYYRSFGTKNWSDDWLYLSMGKQIANGDWFPKLASQPYMIVAPMIPILIALIIKIFGNPYFPFFFYNIVLTSLVVVVLFYLGQDLFNKKIGWLLAFWSVFYIEYFRYNTHLLKEATVFLFLPLTLLFLIKSIKSKSNVKFILFASLSFAWLLHSDERFFIYFPIFSFIFFFTIPFRVKKTIQLVSIWIGFGFLFMLPWGIRNYLEFNQVVIISPRTTAFTSKIWGKDIAKMPFTYGNEIPKDRYYKRALDFEKLHGITPRKYGKIEANFRAFINFWQPAYFKATYIQYGFRPQKWSLAHNFAGLLFYGIYLPLYLIGIVILIKRKYLLGISIAMIPIIHSLLHAYMIWPLERYRSPIVFIVVMIGIWAALHLKKTTH